MPQKPRQQRERQARAEGTSHAVKATDRGPMPLRSNHAAKKSGRVVARAGTAERHVSAKRPPGKGQKVTAPPTGRAGARGRVKRGRV